LLADISIRHHDVGGTTQQTIIRMATEERVLCFERSLLEQLGLFQGLSLDVEKYLPALTSTSHLVYLNRSEAEQNVRYKQLIPYVLLICRDKILRYRRGHISEEDHSLFSSHRGYHEGMRRELMEEVAVTEEKDAAVAVINDDSTEVGMVHFGVVHVMHVNHEKVAGRRSGILGPEFLSIHEAVKDLAVYETWSRFCLQHVDLLLSKAAAAGVIAPPERSES
jgi:predicted NUDIX family phosphoesterase